MTIWDAHSCLKPREESYSHDQLSCLSPWTIPLTWPAESLPPGWSHPGRPPSFGPVTLIILTLCFGLVLKNTDTWYRESKNHQWTWEMEDPSIPALSAPGEPTCLTRAASAPCSVPSTSSPDIAFSFSLHRPMVLPLRESGLRTGCLARTVALIHPAFDTPDFLALLGCHVGHNQVNLHLHMSRKLCENWLPRGHSAGKWYYWHLT